MLHELFGAGVEKMKIDVRTFQTSSNRKIEFNVISSQYHLELTPSDLGNNDRVVIQDLIKEVAQTEQVDFSTGKHRFKVIVINEADSLSRDAQAALRRTMEKYSRNIRLILISNTTSNIIPPIKSRTLLIRISLPQISDIINILNKITEKKQVNIIENEMEKHEIFQNIAISSKRNLRRSILLYESLSIQNELIKTSTPMIDLDWEIVIRQLAANIEKDHSVTRISNSRTVFYELLSHCIPPKIILKNLLFELIKIVKKETIPKIIEAAAEFDERLSLGSKSIFHLEGFITKVMVVLEKN